LKLCNGTIAFERIDGLTHPQNASFFAAVVSKQSNEVAKSSADALAKFKSVTVTAIR